VTGAADAGSHREDPAPADRDRMRPLDVVIDPNTPLQWMGGVFLVVMGALLVLSGATGLAAMEFSGRLKRLPRARKTSYATAMVVLVLLGFVAVAFALMVNRFGFAAATARSG
jgi:hypothetical protein